ncbi:unnamed protein product [Macrosiphum euphorbiae]|uniref:Uncharacterized protein n=1 Tax=Macrosiphum euphorbiae TaxID=13131 RepID=A0AAV0WDQ1_9HEMI|nr:unnamed protein product [Macrosiphum euphorbiae]
MNTVRLCFTATVTCLAVAISWSATDARVCCDVYNTFKYNECFDLTSHLATPRSTTKDIPFVEFLQRALLLFPPTKSTSFKYTKLETIGNEKCVTNKKHKYQMTRAWPVPLCLNSVFWANNTIHLVELIEV